MGERIVGICIGDVTGIGPEVALKAVAEEAQVEDGFKYVLIGDVDHLENLNESLRLKLTLGKGKILARNPRKERLPERVEQGSKVAADAADVRALVSAMGGVVVGSIGPVCSEALRRAGIGVDVEPMHPKMGPLVAETLRAAPALLAARRRPPSLA